MFAEQVPRFLDVFLSNRLLKKIHEHIEIKHWVIMKLQISVPTILWKGYVFLMIFHLIGYQVVVLLISKFQQRNKILTKVIKYIHTVVFRMAFTFGASTSKPSFGSFGTTAKTTESNVFGGFSTTTTTSSSGNRRLCFYFTQFPK